MGVNALTGANGYMVTPAPVSWLGLEEALIQINTW